MCPPSRAKLIQSCSRLNLDRELADGANGANRWAHEANIDFDFCGVLLAQLCQDHVQCCSQLRA